MPQNANAPTWDRGAAESLSQIHAANTNFQYTPFQSPQQVSDFRAEHRIALANRDVDEILKRYDVADPCARSICGLARIIKMGRFFEFHPDGEWAVIVPVIDVDELVDLLAFNPREPEKWWFRDGAERLLNGGALGDQLMDNHLRVFRTPLEWLKGGCAGVVIFNLNHAFIDLVTAPYGVIGDDDEHTEELRRTMSVVALRNLPRFLKRT